MRSPEAPQPQQGKTPDLFTSQPMTDAQREAFMKDHKVLRPDQITYGPNGEILILGRTVEEWDHENELYEGSDTPYN